METKANYVAVGAFVLIGVLGLLVALLWLAGAQYREEFAYYRTYFTGSVTGLGKGTSVRYNGIEVGRVSELTFDPENPKRVIVTMQVQPSLPIHDDSLASIASEGLTGGSFVEIDGGSKKAPILTPTEDVEIPVIRSKPSTLQQLEDSAQELVAKLNRVADQLNVVLSTQNVQAFEQTLINLQDTTAALKSDMPDLDRTLNNISTASVSLNTDLGDLHKVLGHADQATEGISRVASDLDTQVNGAELAQFVAQSRALVQSLTTLSNEIEAHPTQLIFGDRRKGYTPP
jgi:phospholipid/cholesterol/gamma-HCH transport system substrate-binding protein